MSEFVTFMAAPLAACLLILALNAWLGFHVLERGVIFVDLALAQVAAAGTALALLMGHEPSETTTTAYALGATVVGAALFSLSRIRETRVPQEAFIGIVYAVASAVVILLLEQVAHGAEEIKGLLVGQILWVTWPQVATLALVYGTLGVFHWVLRKRFLLVTLSPQAAAGQGMNLRAWDFLFYLSFGLAITFSVRLAGVLVVFSSLIVPAVVGALFSQRTAVRLALGWGVGVAAALLGFAGSYQADMPTGAALVVAFGLVLLGALGVRSLRRRLAAA